MAARRDGRGRFVARPAAPDDPATPPIEEPGGPSDSFVSELQASWTRYGAATIEQVRRERPHDYLRLMASSLAKQADGKPDAIEAMSDDEIADELRHILGILGPASADPGA
jgi:hypothetical protein